MTGSLLYMDGVTVSFDGFRALNALSLDMIRRLSDGLGLPAEVLVRRYEVKKAA